MCPIRSLPFGIYEGRSGKVHRLETGPNVISYLTKHGLFVLSKWAAGVQYPLYACLLTFLLAGLLSATIVYGARPDSLPGRAPDFLIIRSGHVTRTYKGARLYWACPSFVFIATEDRALWEQPERRSEASGRAGGFGPLLSIIMQAGQCKQSEGLPRIDLKRSIAVLKGGDCI